MNKVVLTGGSGFIGRHAVAALLAGGYEVHLVLHQRAAVLDSAAVHLHQGDLFDSEWQARLFEEVRPSHLLHLAWYTAHGKFWEAPENVGWVRCSLGLFEAFARAGGRRAVMAGTCAEYDWSEGGVCIEGTTPLVPRHLYGVAKDSLRRIVTAYGERNQISTAWGRIFHLYGPGEDRRRLVPSVIGALLASTPAPCTAGLQTRDFMHAVDVASAFVALLQSGLEGPVNVASGTQVLIRDVARLIADKMGRPELLRLGALPSPAGDPPALFADLSRLASTGFRPRYTLETGLDDVIAWWRDNS